MGEGGEDLASDGLGLAALSAAGAFPSFCEGEAGASAVLDFSAAGLEGAGAAALESDSDLDAFLRDSDG